MIVEFGRVHRGVVWHVVIPASEALGGSALPLCFEAGAQIKEVTRDQPPRGGRICPRCADHVNDLATAVTRVSDIRANNIRPNVTPGGDQP